MNAFESIFIVFTWQKKGLMCDLYLKAHQRNLCSYFHSSPFYILHYFTFYIIDIWVFPGLQSMSLKLHCIILTQSVLAYNAKKKNWWGLYRIMGEVTVATSIFHMHSNINTDGVFQALGNMFVRLWLHVELRTQVQMHRGRYRWT